MSKALIYTIAIFTVTQIAVWYQTNGQFVWDSFKKNPIGLAVVFGTIISYLLIMGTRFMVRYFDGLLWPGRFIAFGMGIVSFTFLTWYYLGEGITTKTLVSLIIAISLVSIQILWK